MHNLVEAGLEQTAVQSFWLICALCGVCVMIRMGENERAANVCVIDGTLSQLM